MQRQLHYANAITTLAIIIVALAATATAAGIFSSGGPGQYEYTSIRGKPVMIYGKGLYKDMSSEVAPQGIAQDYVTLLLGIPLLTLSLFLSLRGSMRARYLLAGTLGYFLVTYLFYTVMGMYNKMFMAYIILTGASFYGFILTLSSFDKTILKTIFLQLTPFRATGNFLIFCSISIGLLWLNIIIPPLLNGTIVPGETEHYTTLTVQGLDLAILLPAAYVSAILWKRKTEMGYLLGPVYFIFLSILMTALTAKVLMMFSLGYPVMPVILIIPAFNVATITCTVMILRNIDQKVVSDPPGQATMH